MRDDERFTSADQLPIDLYERTQGLVDAAEIITKYTVFWLAGRSSDGYRVYEDKDVPDTLVGVNVRRTLAFHELAEWIRMGEGEHYDSGSSPPGTAHYDANGIEKIEVERQGGNWEEYCYAVRPLEKEIDIESGGYPPIEDWDLRPFKEDNPELFEDLIRPLQETDPELFASLVEKFSTFSAPASATSGLQGYDLEGAVRRRKAKRKNHRRRDADNGKATPMSDLNLFVPITKYDAKQRLAYGTIAAEVADKVNEILDYESAVPQFKLWSDEISKASDGKSVGNVRVMHQPVVGGKMTQIDYDDGAKKITGIAKVLSDEVHRLIEEGALTGFSIGGGYAKRWKDPTDEKLMRYTPRIAEVSFVDNPCIPGSTFEYVKLDGSVEQRTFKAHPALVLPPNVSSTSEVTDATGDNTHPEGATVRSHEGVQGFNTEKGDEETLMADGTKQKPGVKNPKTKDDGSAQNRHPKPKPDSVKEQSAVESTVHYKTPTASDIATRAVELAKAAGKGDTEWGVFVPQAHEELSEKAATETGKDLRAKADAEAAEEKKKEGVKAEAGKDTVDAAGAHKSDGDPEEAQVWIHPKMPGRTFAKKADMRTALLQSEADDVAAKAAAPAKDILDQIRNVLGGEELDKLSEAESLRKPWASNAALPKSVQGLPDEAKTVFRTAANGQLKRSPDDDEAAMKVGWTAVKNGWKKEGDKWVRKDDEDDFYWLVKREYSSGAREKYAKEGVAMRDGSYPIPDKGALKDAVQAFGRSKNKGAAKRHIVRRARALGATDSLPKDWHASTAKLDQEKHANFGSMQMLMGLLQYAEHCEESLEGEVPMMVGYGETTIEVPKDITNRFGRLIGELGDVCADVLDDLLNAMKDEERAEAAESANKLAGLIESLNKLGARHSKEDMDTIKTAHDMIVKLEPTVCSKLAGSDEMSKAVATAEKALAERDSMAKSLTDMAETLKSVHEDVQKIKNTPVGITPAVGPDGLRRYHIADKAMDMGSIAPTGDGDAGAEKLLSDPDVLKVLADHALRAAQRSPMSDLPGLNYGHKR